MKNFHIISLFPDSMTGYLSESILKRAKEDKKIAVTFYNPCDYEFDLKKRIDDKPYGGGPGMVIRALPVIKAIEAAIKVAKKKRGGNVKIKIIFLSPSGTQFTNAYAKKVAKQYSDVLIVAGRYEGIDARIKKVFRMEDLSVGPFILTGGELPALILVDVIARQIPGVLGATDSLEETRVASPDVYTRPESFTYKGKTLRVPKILLSGHHKKIEAWRMKKIKGKV